MDTVSVDQKGDAYIIT